MCAGKSPGFERKPDYALTMEPAGKLVRVIFAGEIIATSDRAVVMHEGQYDPVYYVPSEDVRLDMLRRSDHSTHCPFKGDASYWSIEVGGSNVKNAVWSYENPFDEVAEIAGALAFYPDKVDAIEVH